MGFRSRRKSEVFRGIESLFRTRFQIVMKFGKPIKIEFHPMRSSSDGVRSVKVVVKTRETKGKFRSILGKGGLASRSLFSE